MADNKNMYVSLDEARIEIARRWQDVELKKRVEEELGENFFPAFKNNPWAGLNRHLCSPDNGFTFFYQCANYINLSPFVSEYLGDIFVSFNEEKKGLGRLRVALEDGTKATVDIMNFHENEKRKLGECVLKNGEKLADFHHNLFKISKYKVGLYENSAWFQRVGSPAVFYYYLLLHFVAHGVFFETFLNEGDENEDAFTNEIVIPAINKIYKKFNLKPLVVKLYPENQNEAEDFYWWSYPPNVNEYIVGYAKEHNLAFKLLRI